MKGNRRLRRNEVWGRLTVTVLTPIVLLSCSTAGQATRQKGNFDVISATVFEVLDRLEALPQWTPEAVGGVLGVGLQRDEQRSDAYSTVYRNPGTPPELWRSVELRLPPKPGPRGMIILESRQANPLSMDEVTARLGNDHSFSPPNPRAPVDEPTAYYEYKRARGVLRVGFRDFDQFKAEVFVLDRM